MDDVGDRKGDWIQTFTGRMFWPLDPRPADVCIEDVSHALSLMCRFNGHCLGFYSVAEHSVLVSHTVPAKHALCGLLHDAAEAYVADVPRPLKRFLANYKEAESLVWASVAERFGLPEKMPQEVKDADEAVLAAEVQQVMVPPPMKWYLRQAPADVRVSLLPPLEAERRFLERFACLVGR